MKTTFLKIISRMALATVLAVAITQISAFAQSAKKPQGIEGLWYITIAVVRCDTGATIFTAHSIRSFIDGGSSTEVADSSLRSAGLGTWRHLRKQNYTAVDRFFLFKADGSFAGSQAVDSEIELTSADEFTATAPFEVFNTDNQVISTGCATATAARLE